MSHWFLSNWETPFTLHTRSFCFGFVYTKLVNVWEVRKQKLYGDDSCPNQLQSQSSLGGLGGTAGVEGERDGKFREGKCYCACYRVNVGACNVCVGVSVDVSVIMCVFVWIHVLRTRLLA